MAQSVFCSNNLLTGVQKKRDRLLCSAFINKCQTFVQIKKAGLRAAVPLYEALVLPFIPNKQHRSPRRICTHTRVPINKYTRHKIYISWGHQLLQCLGIKIEFTRFRKAKNKALRTPFRHKGKVARFDAYILKGRKPYWGLCQTSWLSERGHFPPSKPRRWTFGHKITIFFWNMQ